MTGRTNAPRSAHEPPVHDEVPERGRSQLERVAFFSDAVFAIAATLLVVDLRIPEVAGQLTEEELLAALGDLLPKFYGFAVSIIVIGLYWAGHHRTFGRFVRSDPGLPYLNLPFLICIAFMPFPTSVLGEYPYLTSAVVFYAAWQIVTGAAYLLLWLWATHRRRLLPASVSDGWILERTWLGGAVALAFLITTPVAFISPVAAQIAWWPMTALISLLITRRFDAGAQARPS